MGKKHICLGLLAHVDAGKTTLSEALLYVSGTRRTLGRVDHRDAFLDTHTIERERGITIFSKQALLSTDTMDITLLDTPGHTDFSSEAERTLPVLDCAVLVISGTDGVQAHTVTLWQLLQRYQVPTVLFINKMDLPGADRHNLLTQLKQQLSSSCVDFCEASNVRAEAIAMCEEGALEEYLETGTVYDATVSRLIARRKLFPCCFGSALKLYGIDILLQTLSLCAPQYTDDAFGAKVFKISRDPQGNRLTWVKIVGGSLKVRNTICYRNRQGEEKDEKAVQLRLYSGDKFTAAEVVPAGRICAVTGFSETYIGQGLGTQVAAQQPAMEPVMTYRVGLPATSDPLTALPLLRQLEEEDPQLHVLWNSHTRQIHVQIMGKVQLEVFRRILLDRFGVDAVLDDPRIYYKETIEAPVEGVGHFEPLRHYAEVHLLLEPLPQGSGLVFDSICSTDVLEAHFQNLILTHLAEKCHLGVLTGSPVTDIKITLLIGRAHNKHTEGGDFRQATYRAVRQGLMQARSVLLEPWYDFVLTVPQEQVGRAITDIRAMCGELDTPENVGNRAVIRGCVPASELQDYADQVAAYTQGIGQLHLALKGYLPCHNTQKVVEAFAYNPTADPENTPDSIFCAHGAGFHVPWDRVTDYMHLESPLKAKKPEVITRNLQPEDKTLEAIMRREFGDVGTRLYRAPENRPAEEKLTIRPPRQQYLIVDGYNIIFAWDDLAQTAKNDLDAARRQLMDQLSSFAGFRKCRLVLVFDAYKTKGNPGERSQFHNIQVVFTAEGETADAYIESLVSQIGTNYAVRVVTSDSLVQLSSLRSGVLRMSARELAQELNAAQKEMIQYFQT